MSQCLIILLFVSSISSAISQQIDSLLLFGDIKITLDVPFDYSKKNKTLIVLYALPNGNTTLQTMGKKVMKDDDWHYDIQHIKAQTEFVRMQLEKTNIIVCYLENIFKSWPLWKQKHADYKLRITHIVDTLYNMFTSHNKALNLNGHSGGGSFIFGYISSVEKIPKFIERISFLDSNYGYDSSYSPKLINWLTTVKTAHLNVFAYNDSVALYNGKPVVSTTGGTWYKSHQMLYDFSKHFTFQKSEMDSIIIYAHKKIQFFLKPNPDNKIYHTRQVELNGFIHSILSGTKKEAKGYKYYSDRSYQNLIK
jgi:hypothetical protein